METQMKRILIVEDQSHVHQILANKLDGQGFEIVHCYDGGKALEHIEKHEEHAIDLLILDLMLPTVSGREILVNMKGDAKTKDIPVIVLTAKSRQSEIDEIKAIGADDFVQKPFNPNELVPRIQKLLQSS